MGLAIWVIDGQDGARTEALLDLVKRLLFLFTPNPGCVACESVQRFADPAKVTDEPSVEVCEPAKFPYVRCILGRRPLHDALDLDRIHANASSGEHHTEPFNLRSFELALLWLQEQIILLQTLQDLVDDFAVLFQIRTEDEDVV